MNLMYIYQSIYSANCVYVNITFLQVYKGILPTGELVAIKRAQQGSMQGGLEFKTEIELLSRVHHKNVVKLVGFCFQQGEQMLIYDFVPNGSLKDSLSGIFYLHSICQANVYFYFIF